jgi:hypothetical protein
LEKLVLEGVPQDDLEKCVGKLTDVKAWAAKEKIDRWAFRAALLKSLYDNADEYFFSGEGTFREIAAFDNGVATALKTMKEKK